MFMGQMGSATNPTNDPAWYDAVGQFRAEAAKFNAAWSSLMANASFVASHPQLSPEYQNLVSLGQSVKSKISTMTGWIDTAINAAKNIYNTYAQDINLITGGVLGLGNLGFLVSAAVILASVAAITYFISKVYTFNQKVAAMKAMEAQGVSSQQAYSLTVGTPGSTSVLSQAKSLVLPALGLVAVIVLIRKARG